MSGLASGALGSFGASAWGAMVGDQFAKSAVGTIAFGALRGGVGAELTDGNFWQGVLIGGMVAGLNHTMHRGADSLDDNGYDQNGNKVNDKGGNTTDYLYDKDGKIISSTSVKLDYRAASQADDQEGYGFRRPFKMATGAINTDNSIFEFYAGGKVIGAGLSYLGEGFNAVKVPMFRAIGQGIRTYVPKLGANRYLRIGTSTSRGNEVFRITWGNNSKHLLDINLGKIPKIK